MNRLITSNPPVDLPEIKLVLMDIDGTLLNGPDDALDNVRHQLSRLKMHGVGYSFATGRTLFGARKVVRIICGHQREPTIIAYNGGVIANSDASPWIERKAIDWSLYLNILTICRNEGVSPLVYTCNDRFDFKLEPEMVFAEKSSVPSNEKEFNGMTINRIANLDKIPAGDIIAVLVADPFGLEHVEQLARRFGHELQGFLRVTTSGGRYVEIAHPQATKRIAMKTLCARLKIDESNVMAIGDNYNDLEMLAACGFGVAVANSPNQVKNVCRYVCKMDAASGVVEVLMQLATALNYRKVRQRSMESGMKN